SEEHTSELQSLTNLVCRLLLEKKKTSTEEIGTTGRTRGRCPTRCRGYCSGGRTEATPCETRRSAGLRQTPPAQPLSHPLHRSISAARLQRPLQINDRRPTSRSPT